MKCPTCGFMAVEDAAYCSDCGVILRSEIPGIEGDFVCIIISISRSSFSDEHPSVAGSKTSDAVAEALAHCISIARRYNTDTTKTTDNSLAILFPISKNQHGKIGDAIDFVIALRNELLDSFTRNAEGLILGIGIDMGEITYRDFILTATTGKNSPLNNATRLVRKASPNTVLLSDTVAGKIRDSYSLRPVGFYQLQGGKEALKIFELSAPISSRPLKNRPQKIGTSGFSGQINTILDKLNSVLTTGRAISISIEGTAGSGKTEIANRIIDRLSGENWFITRLFATEEISLEPYFIIRQLANELPEEIKSITGDAGRNPVVNKLLKFASGQKTDLDYRELLQNAPLGEMLEDTVTKAIGIRAINQPILILIDDFHFADSASIAYIEKIPSVFKDTPLAVIAVSDRSKPVISSFGMTISIPELDDAIAETIVNSFDWKSRPDSKTLDYFKNISAGSIGSFVGYLRYLYENNSIIETGDFQGIPDNSHGLAIYRYNRLDEIEKSIIHLLFTIQIPLSIEEMLSFLTGATETNPVQIDTVLAKLVANGFVNETDHNGVNKYRIRISPPPESDIANQPASQSDYLKALVFLEKRDYEFDTIKANVASYLKEPEISARALLSTARRAYLYGIPYDAISILTSALEVANKYHLSNDLRIELYRTRGEIYETEGIFSACNQDFESALKLTKINSEENIEIRQKQYKLLIDRGAFNEVRNRLNAIEENVESVGTETPSYINELFGDLSGATNEPDSAVPYYEKALSSAENNDKRYNLLTKLGDAKYEDGDINGAIIAFNDGLILAEKIDDPKMKADAALGLSKLLLYRFDIDRATYLARRALGWYEAAMNFRAQADSYANLAYGMLLTGNSELFLKYMDLGESILERAPNDDSYIRFVWLKAYYSLIMGDEPNFINNISRSSFKNRRLESPAADIGIYLLHSDFETQITGNFDKATKFAEQARTLLNDCGNRNYRAYSEVALASALRSSGKAGEASSIILSDELRNYGNSNRLFQIEYIRVLGLILTDTGDEDEGINKLKLAISIAKDGGIKFMEARCRLDLTLLTSGKESSDMLNRAIWLFETIGSDFWRNRAESLRYAD